MTPLAATPVRITLAELAEQFGCRLVGDGRIEVTRVATLSGATADAVSFLANPAYRRQLETTRAAAVVVDEKHSAVCPVASLVTSRPYATYARIAARLHPPPDLEPGVDPSASIAGDAQLAASAHVGPNAVIGARCRIGDAAVIGAGAVLDAGVEVGARTRIAPRVTLHSGTRIGARCVVHSGAVIGADGFGFANDGGEWIKIPQLGGVSIGDDVEIGANTTIDRGTIDDTVIEDGVKLDNLIQIAHNVRVGAHTVMAAMVGVAGSTVIGPRCMIGGQAGIINGLTVPADTTITVRGLVTRSIDEPGVYSGDMSVDRSASWRRNAARFRQLDSMAERLRSLERRLDALGKKEED